MELNFLNSVVSINRIKKQEPDNIKKLTKLGKNLYHSIHYYKMNNDKVIRAFETMNSSRYTNFSNTEKLIIMSNMVFVNDEDFAKKMLEVGFEPNTIYQLDNIVSSLKILKSKNLDIKIKNELLDRMIYISQTYFGINNPSIIINKLNLLVVTNPELFQTKTKRKEKILVLN